MRVMTPWCVIFSNPDEAPKLQIPQGSAAIEFTPPEGARALSLVEYSQKEVEAA